MSTPSPIEESAADSSEAIVSVAFSREQALLTGIVIFQALWLGYVMMRGWYSGADLPNIAYATGRDLDWSYLTSPLGGHFGVAQRSVYWMLNRIAPLDWWVAVAIRLAFQALTTVLLWRLMRALVGSRPWLWVVLIGYAFSALLVPGMAALNSGLGLGIAQACLVGALLAHVRYVRERRLTDAAIVAVLVAIMLAFAQQSLPALVILPILTMAFLLEGSFSDRLREAFQMWRGWLLLGAALACFAIGYLSGDYNSPGSDFGFTDAMWLAGQGWLTHLGPALVGGPWRFYSMQYQWSAYAHPPTAVLVLGQVVLFGLILASIRRSGWRAVAAWLIPIVISTAGLVLVGVGRWSFIAEIIPSALRYAFFVPVALALGIVLAFGSTTPDAPATRARISVRWQSEQHKRWLTLAGVSVLILSNVVSTLGFARPFWENPAEEYTATLFADAKERGEQVQLFDTLLPEPVVPGLSGMFHSDLLGLGGVGAEFGGQSANRMIVDPTGHIVTARFVSVADFSSIRRKDCGVYVSGAGTTRIPLEDVNQAKPWFIRFELYQPRPNKATFKVLDVEGEEIPVTSGSNTLEMTGELVALDRRLATGVPDVIELESQDPDTSFCLVHTYVGYPMG